MVWFFSAFCEEGVDLLRYSDTDEGDSTAYQNGLLFPTREAALAAFDKVKEVLKGNQ